MKPDWSMESWNDEPRLNLITAFALAGFAQVSEDPRKKARGIENWSFFACRKTPTVLFCLSALLRTTTSLRKLDAIHRHHMLRTIWMGPFTAWGNLWLRCTHLHPARRALDRTTRSTSAIIRPLALQRQVSSQRNTLPIPYYLGKSTPSIEQFHLMHKHVSNSSLQNVKCNRSIVGRPSSWKMLTLLHIVPNLQQTK